MPLVRIPKEHVDVSTMVADDSIRGLVEPVKIEECHAGGLQLDLALGESVVPTDMANERSTEHLDSISNGSHASIVTYPVAACRDELSPERTREQKSATTLPS